MEQSPAVPSKITFTQRDAEDAIDGKAQPTGMTFEQSMLIAQARLLKSINGKLGFFVFLAVASICISILSALLR